MKKIDSLVVEKGEKDLIEDLPGSLDWKAIEKVFIEKHKIGLQNDIQYKQGEIVIHENRVAYKVDFNVKTIVSVLFDRNGKCISLSTDDVQPVETGAKQKASSKKTGIDHEKKVAEMASEIASLISDINKK